ncbi:MAG TPA: alpha/beta fold hydrolase [Pseudoneobacillus sp.]|nr:alpha/beta fold hydrolase [Pseudoneobacillus sp.]
MEVIVPQPFTFEGGEKAILLLHGFTGSSFDVRMLGRFLESKGYTCHAPQYKGHGGDPETLASSTPEEWWQDVLEGYHYLAGKGYNEIAVTGISLGGIFSLKLAMEKPVTAVIPMCAPMGFKDAASLREMIISYARNYKKIEGKSEKEIEHEVLALLEKPMASVEGLLSLVREVKDSLYMVDVPIMVIQGRQDNIIVSNSPETIVQNVRSEGKKLIWYENSGHMITLEDERNKVEEDIFKYLEKLHWEDHSDLIVGFKETDSPQVQ